MKQAFLILAFLLVSLPCTRASAITADSYVRDGNGKYQEKKYEAAEAAYQVAVKMERTNAAAFQGLGNCYMATGDRDRALVYYQYSLQMNPGNKALAAYLEKLNSPESASPVTAPAGEAARYERYGRYYLDRTKTAYALYYFDKSLEADPSNEQLKSLTSQLRGQPAQDTSAKTPSQAATSKAPSGKFWGGAALATAAVLAIALF